MVSPAQPSPAQPSAPTPPQPNPAHPRTCCSWRASPPWCPGWGMGSPARPPAAAQAPYRHRAPGVRWGGRCGVKQHKTTAQHWATQSPNAGGFLSLGWTAGVEAARRDDEGAGAERESRAHYTHQLRSVAVPLKGQHRVGAGERGEQVGSRGREESICLAPRRRSTPRGEPRLELKHLLQGMQPCWQWRQQRCQTTAHAAEAVAAAAARRRCRCRTNIRQPHRSQAPAASAAAVLYQERTSRRARSRSINSRPQLSCGRDVCQGQESAQLGVCHGQGVTVEDVCQGQRVSTASTPGRMVHPPRKAARWGTFTATPGPSCHNNPRPAPLGWAQRCIRGKAPTAGPCTKAGAVHPQQGRVSPPTPPHPHGRAVHP